MRWKVNVLDHDPYTIWLQTVGGPAVLKLAHPKSGPEVAKNDTKIHSKSKWVVAGDGGEGAHHGFYRLKNLHTHTYLDLSDSHHNDPVGHDRRAKNSQLWKFVPLHGSWDKDQRHDYMNKARHDFRLANAQELRQKEQAAAVSRQPASSNLCGDPTCGVTHIYNADYNRHVVPLGYSGV